MKSIGDINEGRPNLGDSVPVFVYRLYTLAIADVLEKSLGKEKADELIREAGLQSGMEFGKSYLDTTLEFDKFVTTLEDSLSENRIGILRIEHVDLEKGELMLTVFEDLDCSGLSVYDETVCVYDEGFLSGILEYYTGLKFTVREIDCWANGDRACRFFARSQ